MLINIFRALPLTSDRLYTFTLAWSSNHRFKIIILRQKTIKFTFFVLFYFLCFGFDHGIALSITRISNFPRTCEFLTNGEPFWTVITYLPGPDNTGR